MRLIGEFMQCSVLFERDKAQLFKLFNQKLFFGCQWVILLSANE